MTETPYSPADFPENLEWFDVTRYDTASDMTIDQWRQQIGKRAFIRDLLTLGGLEQLRNDQMGQLLDYPLTESPVSESRTAASTVFELTPAYARALVDGYEETHQDSNRADISFNEVASVEALEGLGHRAYLVADLGASDDVTRRDFATWLNNFKRSKGLKHTPAVTELTLTDWHGRFKILPYFDLWAWGQWTDNELPRDPRLLELLFPDDLAATVDAQLRTTKRKAMELITWRMHAALTEQIRRNQPQ